jgi:hypothetical protein
MSMRKPRRHSVDSPNGQAPSEREWAETQWKWIGHCIKLQIELDQRGGRKRQGERDAEIFRLMEKLTGPEVAELLGMTPSAVRQAYRRERDRVHAKRAYEQELARWVFELMKLDIREIYLGRHPLIVEAIEQELGPSREV